jgi:AcrR family transcriptional regulator
MSERRPRSSVTAEGILDAAERVSAGGFEALTVRAVAADMGASPMALYRYFATKDELVDGLLDRIFGRFVAEPPSDDWAGDLATFALAHRRLLAQYPWAIVPLFTHPNPGPNAARIGELALGILRRGGIADTDAVATFCAILALNYGWSAFSSARAAAALVDRDPGVVIRAAISALPEDGFPLTRAVADQMSDYGSDEHYAVALRHLIAGIRSNAPADRLG